MRGKKIIVICMIFLLIILLVIILNLLNIKNNEIIKDAEKSSTESEQNIEYDNNSYDSSVYYEENGVIYSTSGEPKDGIDFTFVNIPQEVLNYLNDTQSFYNTLKVYAFSNELDKKANKAVYERYEYQQESNRLAIAFILDNSEKTEIVFIVNLNDNTIEIVLLN